MEESETHPPPRALLVFLKPYDRAIRELALGIRAIVIEEIRPCCEHIYDAYNAVALGYGPTDRFKDGICHIAVYTRHVNLGFNRGASLDDPYRLLKGSGKSIRHITIRVPSDLNRPEIRDYLRRAREQAGHLIGARTGMTALTSVVKGIYPKKRRPGRKGGTDEV